MFTLKLSVEKLPYIQGVNVLNAITSGDDCTHDFKTISLYNSYLKLLRY